MTDELIGKGSGAGSAQTEGGAPGSGDATGSHAEREGRHGVGRRDVIKALASIPVLGVFFYTFLEKRARDELKRQAIMSELGIGEGAPAYIPQAISRSPGNTIRLGIIGYGAEGELLVRNAGFAHPEWVQEARECARTDPRDRRLEDYLAQADLNVALTGVCDVYDVRAERGLAASRVETRPGSDRPVSGAKRYRHYHDMLESDEIDAVVIATPDHWHARMAMDAAAAGKHIYLEKCMTRTEEEAHALAAAITGSDVVFQLGHQNRQAEDHIKAREVIAKGILGPVTLVETTTNRNTPTGAWLYDIPEEAGPETIDWDQFQGPAPHKVPFSLERFFRWRCWFDYGTGLVGDLLSHEFDAINHILDLGIPKSATASGGVYFFKDGREVPDVFQAALEYPDRDLTLVYSATLANAVSRGRLFMGHDASMYVGNGLTIRAEHDSTRYEEKIEAGVIDPSIPMFTYRPGFKGIDAVTSATEAYFASRGLLYTYRGGKRVASHHLHLGEWLDVIRHGGEPSCGIERGFEEAIACHMATQSYLQGRRVQWDPVARRIV